MEPSAIFVIDWQFAIFVVLAIVAVTAIECNDLPTTPYVALIAGRALTSATDHETTLASDSAALFHRGARRACDQFITALAVGGAPDVSVFQSADGILSSVRQNTVQVGLSRTDRAPVIILTREEEQSTQIMSNTT
jgi:hypothetical protein